jgi:hypothetical protein
MSEPDWSLPMNRAELIARCEALTSTANARLEVIQWHAVTEQLPDADTTVLVCAPEADDPVWLGFYDGFFWFLVTLDGYGDPDQIAAEVIAWAPVPRGPS